MSTPSPLTSSVAAVLSAIGAKVLIRDWLSANNIVFAGRGGAPPTVVDTGYGAHAAQTVALVRYALEGAPLGRIVNTHLHSDHCGGNAALLLAWPGARLSVPAGYRKPLSPWNDDLLSFRATDQLCEPFEPTDYHAAGDRLKLGTRQWEVHATPGHDPDAVVLFEPESRVLISGDALWERRLAIIFPELGGKPGFTATRQALDTIERLDPALVIPGHGRVFDDVKGALSASRRRLDQFEQSPDRHRQHAVRALVAFHMLEHRRVDRAKLISWMARTSVFLQALQCESDTRRAENLAADIISGMLMDSVLRANGESLTLAVPSAGE